MVKSRVLRVLLYTCVWWQCGVILPVRIALQHELDAHFVHGETPPDAFVLLAMAVGNCYWPVFVRH